MGDAIGQTIELDVTNIAHGGVSVARHEGRVVFVTDAIPGERVQARVTDDRKKAFWRADTVRVLEPSEHRRPHVWSAASIDRDPADRAGGAEFGHIALPHQRELKRRVLAESLQRMAQIESDVEVEALPGDDPDGTGWRTRVRLHVDDEGRVGPFAARSHRVIPVTDLPLATTELASGAPLGETFPGETFVDVLNPSTGGVRLVIGEQKRSTITERVGSREFRLSDTGFWQVHRGAAQALTDAVQHAVDAERFDPAAANLDLYGGVGLLAAALGDRFGASVRVTSVESDSVATDFAAENLADWVGARAETGRVDRWLRTLASSAGASERARLSKATVILDPPRSGAGREVVDLLGSIGPAQVVYVACDPVAFARDVALFAGHGYALERLRAFDLFPNTHHVEAVGTLARA
jgi:tRNA/tmRNA/rRNA uracil-C5-methylase (TrmA/RlmC/RlmD family)